MEVLANVQFKISLDEKQQKEIVKKYLLNLIRLDHNYCCENGKIFLIKQFHTSHSWMDKEFVKNASELENCVFKIINSI